MILSVTQATGYSVGFVLDDGSLNDFQFDLWGVIEGGLNEPASFSVPLGLRDGQIIRLDQLPGYLGMFKSTDGVARQRMEARAKT